MRELSDSDLVARFTGFVQPKGEMSQEEAAAALSRTAGKRVHQTTVSRWVLRGAKRLESHTRRALEDFLAERDSKGPGKTQANETPPLPEDVKAEISRYRDEPHRNGVDWVPRLIERVLEGEYDGRLKLGLIEAIAAAGRNHTAYGEAMAAVQRGVAMETEGSAAIDRAVVNRRAEENAPARGAGLVEEVVLTQEEFRQLGENGEVHHPIRTLKLTQAPHSRELAPTDGEEKKPA